VKLGFFSLSPSTKKGAGGERERERESEREFLETEAFLWGPHGQIAVNLADV
jgi:hypothetical protein